MGMFNSCTQQSKFEECIPEHPIPTLRNYLKTMRSLEQIVFYLSNENIIESAEKTMKLFNNDFPLSFNLVLSQLIYSSFISQIKDFNIYIRFMKEIKTKEEGINKSNHEIIDTFLQFLHGLKAQESSFLKEIIELWLFSPDSVQNKKMLYFTNNISYEKINHENLVKESIH